MMSSRSTSVLGFSIAVALLVAPIAGYAQAGGVTPAQIVSALPAPLPVEVRPFATGAPNPFAPLAQVRSVTHVNCIKRQLGEIQKVADAAGGNEALATAMRRVPVIFEVLSNDTTSGRRSRLRPGLSRAFEPGRAIWLITNIVSVDEKTHQVQCEYVPSERLIEWLEKDVNHTVRFPGSSNKAARPNPRGSR
ncbi:MAG: hypothetical protein V4760_04695 [Bdellovibrionota bacterium]